MAFTYLVVDSFSIVFLLILFASTREQSAGLSETRCFRLIVLCTVLALLGDMMSWQLDGRPGAYVRAMLWGFNLLCYVLSGLMALGWFYYVGLKLGRNHTLSRGKWALLSLPALVLATASLATPFTGWMFALTPDNTYVRGPLFFLQVVVPLGYLFAAALRAGLHSRAQRLRQQKRECLYLSAFILFPLLGSVLQLAVYGLSLAWPATALSLMLVYVNLQKEKISLDALTGLNNRGQLDKYLYNCLERGEGAPPFALYMLDIDNFKSINDQFGHTAGDAALVCAADILRRALGGTNAFLARYGGDEFSIVLVYGNESQVAAVPAAIEGEAARFNAQNAAYSIVFSIGWVCSDSHRFTGYQDMITAADARMYLEKQQHKAPRA